MKLVQGLAGAALVVAGVWMLLGAAAGLLTAGVLLLIDRVT